MSTLFTIGHSNRALDAFLRTLQQNGIKSLVDVRKMPRSRANPYFNRETLPQELASIGIRYAHAPGLAGLRPAHRNSINTAWRNKSFQGYADHMQTAEFREALADLLARARREPTAVMCAEVLPWRCHRSLIADAALAHGFEVKDIFDEHSVKPHHLPSFAKVHDQQVYYPGEEIEG